MRHGRARSRRHMHVRVLILAGIIAIGAGAVLVKAWELQVQRGPSLRQAAQEQYQRDLVLSPKRGGIYDRDGAELAVSIDVDSVWANPQQLSKASEDPAAVAQRLSELLGVDAAALTQRLTSDKHFVWVKRRVSAAQGNGRALALPWVATSEEARRLLTRTASLQRTCSALRASTAKASRASS